MNFHHRIFHHVVFDPYHDERQALFGFSFCCVHKLITVYSISRQQDENGFNSTRVALYTLLPFSLAGCYTEENVGGKKLVAFFVCRDLSTNSFLVCVRRRNTLQYPAGQRWIL